MINFSASLTGMSQAVSQVNGVAQRLSTAGAAASGQPQDTVDLSHEMVALLAASQQLKTGVKLAQTADEMGQAAISLLG